MEATKRIAADLTPDEYKAFIKGKHQGETYRDYILRLAKIDAAPRQVGRPRRIPSSLDMLGRPGFIPATDGSVAKKELAEVYGDGWKPKKEGE